MITLITTKLFINPHSDKTPTRQKTNVLKSEQQKSKRVMNRSAQTRDPMRMAITDSGNEAKPSMCATSRDWSMYVCYT